MSLPLLSASWAASLKSVADAAEQFWPTIANYGFAFNVIFLKLVDSLAVFAAALKPQFQDAWTGANMDALQAAGLLHT